MQLLRNGASRLVAGEVQQNPVVLRGPSQVRAILALHLFTIDQSKLCGMPPDGMRAPIGMAPQQFANRLPLSAPTIPVTFAQNLFVFMVPYGVPAAGPQSRSSELPDAMPKFRPLQLHLVL